MGGFCVLRLVVGAMKSKRYTREDPAVLSAIRGYCITQCEFGGTEQSVDCCVAVACPLWSWRMGAVASGVCRKDTPKE